MVSKVFVLAFIGLVAVNVVVGADTLKCYQCEDCETAKDSKLCTKDDFAPEGETTSSTTVSTTTNNDGDSSPTPTTEDSTITTTETDSSSTTDATTTTEKVPAEERVDEVSTTTTTTTKAPTTESTEMAYSCYKVKDGEGQIQRGCTKKVENCEKLTLLSEKWECLNVCSTEDCNAATNMQSLAFSTVIFVAIIKMLLN